MAIPHVLSAPPLIVQDPRRCWAAAYDGFTQATKIRFFVFDAAGALSGGLAFFAGTLSAAYEDFSFEVTHQVLASILQTFAIGGPSGIRTPWYPAILPWPIPISMVYPGPMRAISPAYAHAPVATESCPELRFIESLDTVGPTVRIGFVSSGRSFPQLWASYNNWT